MNNPLNCWKPKSNDRAISSEASDEERSETIREGGVHTKRCGSGGHPAKDEDIVRSLEKSSGSVATVYVIKNRINNKQYVGITRTSLARRWNSHVHASKTRSGYLYNAIRKYSIDNFYACTLVICSWEYACELERQLISTGSYEYNLAKGGEGGYVVPASKEEEWRDKLSKARKGRRPSLGMKHTKENKELFSIVSKAYWDTQSTYNKEEVIKVSYKEAKDKYGISKTHYYRLKRALSSDQC